MYWIAGCTGCFYAVLYVLSKREQEHVGTHGVLSVFYRMAGYIYKKAWKIRVPVLAGRQVKRDLEQLHPGENSELLYTDYYIKKIALSLMIYFFGTFLGVILCVQSDRNRIMTAEYKIPRTSYEEGGQDITIKTAVSPGNEKSFQITVEPKMMSQEELAALRKHFHSLLPELMIGDNPSLQEVYYDLRLAEEYDQFPFVLEWKSNCPDLVSATGMVFETFERQPVLLEASVNYGDIQWKEVIEITVVPFPISEEERIHKEIMELLKVSEENSRGEEEWILPDTYNGKALGWQQVIQNNSLVLWSLAFFVAIAVYWFSDKDLHSLLLNRREKMKRAYPDVVHKLVLYMGAGMTIRGAFYKMSADTKARGPIYEEILFTCRELKAGVSEGAAYEHFGKRTGLQEYIRLSTLLAQNLKKGNSMLLTRLREEAQKASLERVHSSRRLGEEAGTKLLVPMIMMLAMVMLIIMIPAFSTMG